MQVRTACVSPARVDLAPAKGPPTLRMRRIHESHCGAALAGGAPPRLAMGQGRAMPTCSIGPALIGKVVAWPTFVFHWDSSQLVCSTSCFSRVRETGTRRCQDCSSFSGPTGSSAMIPAILSRRGPLTMGRDLRSRAGCPKLIAPPPAPALGRAPRPRAGRRVQARRMG